MNMEQGQLARLVALGVTVLLEGFAVLSVVLQVAFFPLGIYPNIVSVAVFVLPSLVGLLSRRLEVALLLAVAPFWTLAVIYLAIFKPVWDLDLLQLGVLASRVASLTILLGALGALGWLVRRVAMERMATAMKVR